MDIVKATVDFYVLESLHAELPAQNYAKVHPAMSARLHRDLGKERDRLSEDFALALRDYLFVASCGEARHAQDKCIPTLVGIGGRNDVYVAALDYAPTAENWQRLQDVFEQDWPSGFGGKAWKNICEHAAMFDTLPHVAYVDHVIDLAHNGGCAFNKPVEKVLDFQHLYHYEAKDAYYGQRSEWFAAFLDYKRDAASLALQDAGDLNTLMRIHTSGRVKELVRQFCNVFRLELPAWLEHNPDGDLCQEYKPCAWRGGTLPELDYRSSAKSHSNAHSHQGHHSRYGNCDNCGCRLGEYDSWSVDYNVYCEDCFSELFTYCEKCGETISNEDARHIDGSDYCAFCAHKIASRCKACHRWHLDRRMYGDLCHECAEDYVQCYECGDAIECVDAKQYLDNDYCQVCWHSIVDKPCSACGKFYSPGDLTEDKRGSLFCAGCATVCDSCGTAVEKTVNGDGMTPIVFEQVWHRMAMPFLATSHSGSDALYCRACAAHVGMKGQLTLA